MGFRYRWLALLLVVGTVACVNDPNTLGLSNSTFSSDYRVVVVDTVTVKVSTVLLDSFPTSNTGTLLVGGYDDARLGRIDAEGYLQITTGSVSSIVTDAVFDSLVLIAHYDAYSYGDTTSAPTFEVRRLAQPFQTWALPQFWVNENQYSSLYAANSKFNASAMRTVEQPLGTRTISIRPHSQDSITIRLSDDLGKEWLRLAKEKAADLTDASRFLEYFKGIQLGTSGTGGSVIGIKTENLKIRLYYRTYGGGDRLVEKYIDFPYSSGLFSYTRFEADRTGTSLNGLSVKNNEIFSGNTDNTAFLQSGSGVVTKLSFPYLTRLLRLTNVLLVNQAQLIIEPVKGSYSNTFPLPSSLTLYHTDKTNLPRQRVYANYNTSAYQMASVSFDDEFDTSTGYLFTVTQLTETLLGTDEDTDRGLLIMPPLEEMNKTVNRAYFGAGGNYRVRLKIWYTTSK